MTLDPLDPAITKAFSHARHRQVQQGLLTLEQALCGAPEVRQRLLQQGMHVLRWYGAALEGRFQDGLNEALQSISELQERGYRPSMAWAMTAAGFCMGMVGDVELGLKWTDEAGRAALDQGDELMRKRARSDKAALLGMMGNFEGAIALFREVLAETDAAPHRERSSLINNLAFCYLSLASLLDGDPLRRQALAAEALAHATEAARGMDTQELRRLKNWALSTQGAALALLGRHEEAEAAFRQALPDVDLNRRNAAVLMSNYARLLVDTGRHDEALGNS